MKRCPTCKQLKPEGDFYKNAYQKDGLSIQCKSCSNQQIYKSKIKSKNKLDDFNIYLGGYKISILKYTKKGEFKYTIVSTRGGIFQSNNKDKFLAKIQEVI